MATGNVYVDLILRHVL